MQGESEMTKTMDEKVEFMIPSDELAAFRHRVSSDGMTVGFFLRMSISNYLNMPSREHVRSDALRKTPLSIPFCGCLRGDCGDYRDRAAEYVLKRCT